MPLLRLAPLLLGMTPVASAAQRIDVALSNFAFTPATISASDRARIGDGKIELKEAARTPTSVHCAQGRRLSDQMYAFPPRRLRHDRQVRRALNAILQRDGLNPPPFLRRT